MKFRNVLKHIMVTAALLAALGLRSFAASPEAEARFVVDARAAFDSHDSTKLIDLVCWDRIPPDLKSVMIGLFSEMMKKPVDHLELAPAAPTDKLETTRNGVTYRPNLEVIKKLKVTFKTDKASHSEASFPVGEKGGKLFITLAAPVK